MNNENTEQDRISESMCQMLELSHESEEKVKAAIKNLGMKNFFLNAHSLNINEEEVERILALKEVIKVYQATEGGKMDVK